MAKFRVLAVPYGVHHSPDGVVRATPRRVRHWVNSFKRMTKKGVRVPVAWGHAPSAVPYRDEESFQIHASRAVAGYVTDMAETPEGLVVEGDAPGCELDEQGRLMHWYRVPGDSRELRGSIGEVSVGVNNWRDGSGHRWDDVIIHLACTPLPVVAGQPGFTPIASPERANPVAAKAVHLSTVTLRKPTMTATACRPEPCSLFEPDDLEADLADEGESSVNLSTLGAADSSHPLVRATKNRVWRRNVKARLLTLCRKGLDPNAATGLWAAVNGEQGIKRLNTSGNSIRERIEAQLSEWEEEYRTRRPETPLPLSKEEREIADLLTTRR